MRVNADEVPGVDLPFPDQSESRVPGDPFPIAGHGHDEQPKKWLTCEWCGETGPDVKLIPDNGIDDIDSVMVPLCRTCR